MQKFGRSLKDSVVLLTVQPPIQMSLFPSYYAYFPSFSAEYKQNLHLLLEQLCWQDHFGANFALVSRPHASLV